jgi:hypothetical protein
LRKSFGCQRILFFVIFIDGRELEPTEDITVLPGVSELCGGTSGSIPITFGLKGDTSALMSKKIQHLSKKIPDFRICHCWCLPYILDDLWGDRNRPRSNKINSWQFLTVSQWNRMSNIIGFDVKEN